MMYDSQQYPLTFGMIKDGNSYLHWEKTFVNDDDRVPLLIFLAVLKKGRKPTERVSELIIE